MYFCPAGALSCFGFVFVVVNIVFCGLFFCATWSGGEARRPRTLEKYVMEKEGKKRTIDIAELGLIGRRQAGRPAARPVRRSVAWFSMNSLLSRW